VVESDGAIESASAVINQSPASVKGPQRHFYDASVTLQMASLARINDRINRFRRILHKFRHEFGSMGARAPSRVGGQTAAPLASPV